MAAVALHDRVKESSSTTGTGAFTTAGAETGGFRTINSTVGTGNSFFYTIQNTTASEWEVGIGTSTGATTFSRDTVLSSSNGGSLVSFTAGTKDCFVAAPKDYLQPMTTIGDSVYQGSNNRPTRLPLGTAGQVYASNGTTPFWANPVPVIDSIPILYNASDATKLLRVDVSNISTATTRILSVQDAAYTLAGTNLDNAFTVGQSITPASAAAITLKPFGSSAGNTAEMRFRELVANGTNVVGFKAPDSISADKVWVLPNADGSSGQFLTTDGGLTLSWATGASFPTTDSQTIVKGSGDATKLLRFEVDGFTTGTTRVLTPQDADTTIAGINLNNYFTTDQYVGGPSGDYVQISKNDGSGNPIIHLFNSGVIDATISAKSITEFDGTISLISFNCPIDVAGAIYTSGGFLASSLTAKNTGTKPLIRNWYTSVEFFDWETTSAGTCTWKDATGTQLMIWGSGSTAVTPQWIGIGDMATIGSRLHVRESDTGTTNVPVVLIVGHQSSGTPAANYGAAQNFQLKSSTTADRNAASIVVSWIVATDASRTARLVLNTYDTAVREGIRIDASGSAALVGIGGAADSTRLLKINGDTTTTGWVQQVAARSRMTADATKTNTTFANLTDLSLTLTAGRMYTGKLVVKCINDTATEGIKFDFNGGTATMTGFWAAAGILASGGTDVIGTNISTSLAGVINFTTFTGESVVVFQISLVVNAAGTFIPRFAENSTAVGTATVRLGSYLWLEDSPL